MLGPFDSTLHIPAFFEGGRTTVNGYHLLDGVPVHTTPFAADSLHSFDTSYLPSWISKKSNGVISEESVLRIDNYELDPTSSASFEALVSRLRSFNHNVSVSVDSTFPEQLEMLSRAVHLLCPEKRFLFRTAASMVKALSLLPSPPTERQPLPRLRIRGTDGSPLPGFVLVGSHVPLATQQLSRLVSSHLMSVCSSCTFARALYSDSPTTALHEPRYMA